MERYPTYEKLSPAEKMQINTELLTAPSAPIFIHTSQGYINLCAINRVIAGWVLQVPDETEILVIHLSCGTQIDIIDTQEISHIMKLLPIWCRVFS